MITGFITFFTIFAVVGAILYGRKLIKTEKTDAVFGNPERAKGGMHWVVVGSSFLLLSWLYYSWDIAKSFYPKSANELCQVAKVNESLLSLKYLFPIVERQHKSTAIIKRENINIEDKIILIQNDPNLKDQDKEIFINILRNTKLMIPSLTDEKYLEDNDIAQGGSSADFVAKYAQMNKDLQGGDAGDGTSIADKYIRNAARTNPIDIQALDKHIRTSPLYHGAKSELEGLKTFGDMYRYGREQLPEFKMPAPMEGVKGPDFDKMYDKSRDDIEGIDI